VRSCNRPLDRQLFAFADDAVRVQFQIREAGKEPLHLAPWAVGPTSLAKIIESPDASLSAITGSMDLHRRLFHTGRYCL
jgi:hypothetical protein